MNNPRLQIDGFKKWDAYYGFAKDKYSDVSVALLQKDFELSKRALRELIDNTCPYHSKGMLVKSKDEKGKDIDVPMLYEDYFELIVDQYEDAKVQEKNPHTTPEEKDKIPEIYNFFYQQVRLIRRMIIKDISTAGIIPTAELKTDPVINNLLTGKIDPKPQIDDKKQK